MLVDTNTLFRTLQPSLNRYSKKRSRSLSIEISHETEARITHEAQRQGISVDALLERLINEREATAPAAIGRAHV